MPAGELCLAGARPRVPEGRPSDRETPKANGHGGAHRSLVEEQLPEDVPERVGGRVVPAPQCHLGLRLQQRVRHAGGEPGPRLPQELRDALGRQRR